MGRNAAEPPSLEATRASGASTTSPVLSSMNSTESSTGSPTRAHGRQLILGCGELEAGSAAAAIPTASQQLATAMDVRLFNAPPGMYSLG